MSLHWAGDTSGRNFSSCYTSWGRQDNVIRSNMSTTFSGFSSSAYQPSNLIDGLASVQGCCGSCFYSSNHTHSYWQVNFGTPVRVKAVTITTGFSGYFKNVDIRLGNSSNHLNNPVFASVATFPGYSSCMTITGQVHAGRYLALSNQKAGLLLACEIQVHEG